MIGDKPATTIIAVPDKGIDAQIHILVEVVALVPKEGMPGKESIVIPELAGITEPYPHAVKVGQFLFFSGFTGTDPGSGRVVTKLVDLGPDATHVRSGSRNADASSEATKVQTWLIHRHFERVLKEQGGRSPEEKNGPRN